MSILSLKHFFDHKVEVKGLRSYKVQANQRPKLASQNTTTEDHYIYAKSCRRSKQNTVR